MLSLDSGMLNAVDRQGVIALIPARGGSKSVPKKNIREFRGHPLIAYSIAAAKRSSKISRVLVSTDSAEIAEIARRYGAETPFLRPAEYAQDDSPDIDVVKHAIHWLYENEGRIPEYWVHLRPTTPIRSPNLMEEAVRQIMNDPAATSLRSGSICVHPPYKWFAMGENGYLRALMPGMTCDEANLPRQDFPTVYIPNGYVDVLKADFIIKNDRLHGERMIGYRTEEIPDIDTELDLKKLEIFPTHKEALQLLADYLADFKKG